MGQQQIRKAPESSVEKKSPRCGEEEQLLRWEDNQSRMLCLNARAKIWHVEGVTNCQISFPSQVRGGPVIKGSRFFVFVFDFALLCWCLCYFRMRKYHFMGVGLRENGKKLEIPSMKFNLSPLKFISYSFGKIYLLWDIY